jgi:Flp pilus assembly pilin Flp
MNAWLKRVIVALAALVLVAGMTRLVWELLGPVLPTLIALLIVAAILARIVSKSKQW